MLLLALRLRELLSSKLSRRENVSCTAACNADTVAAFATLLSPDKNRRRLDAVDSARRDTLRVGRLYVRFVRRQKYA